MTPVNAAASRVDTSPKYRNGISPERYNYLQACDCRSSAPLLAAAHVAAQHPFQESGPPVVKRDAIPRYTPRRVARQAFARF